MLSLAVYKYRNSVYFFFKKNAILCTFTTSLIPLIFLDVSNCHWLVFVLKKYKSFKKSNILRKYFGHVWNDLTLNSIDFASGIGSSLRLCVHSRAFGHNIDKNKLTLG